MYSTSSEHTRVPWAAHSYNVAFSDEIGHFEYCSTVGRGRRRARATTSRASTSDDDGCFSAGVSTLVPIGGCIATDNDFDGVSYQKVWPGTDPNRGQDKKYHPSSVLFTSPLFNATQNYSSRRVRGRPAADRGRRLRRQLRPVHRHELRQPAAGGELLPDLHDRQLDAEPERERPLRLAARRHQHQGNDEHVRRKLDRRVRTAALQLLPEPEPGGAKPDEQLPQDSRLEPLPGLSRPALARRERSSGAPAAAGPNDDTANRLSTAVDLADGRRRPRGAARIRQRRRRRRAAARRERGRHRARDRAPAADRACARPRSGPRARPRAGGRRADDRLRFDPRRPRDRARRGGDGRAGADRRVRARPAARGQAGRLGEQAARRAAQRRALLDGVGERRPAALRGVGLRGDPRDQGAARVVRRRERPPRPRHRQRDDELHPVADGERRRVPGRAGGGAASRLRGAGSRPRTSTAPTPPRRWRSWRRWRSARARRSTTSSSRGSRA